MRRRHRSRKTLTVRKTVLFWKRRRRRRRE
jgi:hypothetical protein